MTADQVSLATHGNVGLKPNRDVPVLTLARKVPVILLNEQPVTEVPICRC